MNKDAYYVHPTAIVESSTIIGSRTTIWHHCHIREKSILGDDVSLGKGVFIDQFVEVGKGCRIQNGVSVYRGVLIKDWVFVGPNVTFTNDRHPRAGAKSWELSETILMPGCSIGAGSIILSGLTIGTFALVGAASVVTNDVPPFHLAYGLPTKIISMICACGDTRLELKSSLDQCLQECCMKKLKDEVIQLAKHQIQELGKHL
jgi:acetyltransferase-like isoleucine patch superfamily enzyme